VRLQVTNAPLAVSSASAVDLLSLLPQPNSLSGSVAVSGLQTTIAASPYHRGKVNFPFPLLFYFTKHRIRLQPPPIHLSENSTENAATNPNSGPIRFGSYNLEIPRDLPPSPAGPNTHRDTAHCGNPHAGGVRLRNAGLDGAGCWEDEFGAKLDFPLSPVLLVCYRVEGEG